MSGYVIASMVAAAAAGVGCLLRWGWRVWETNIERGNQEHAEKVRRICSLSLTEAQRRMEALLSDPERFGGIKVRRAEMEDAPQLDFLAPVLRGFFQQYASFRYVGGVWLGWDQIRLCEELRYPDEIQFPPEQLRGFLRIGQDDWGGLFVAKPGQEPVYWVAGEGAEDRVELFPEGGYPTIYHLLLDWLE